MSWSTAIQDAVTRLKTFYNGGTYDSGTNAGGLGQGGHRVNFVPALEDVGDVAEAIGTAAEQVSEDAAATLDAALYYLGASASNPTTMRDSTALQNGAFYFNTGTSRLRVYSGSWTEIEPVTDYWNTPRVIANSDSPVTAVDRDILLCRTSTGAIEVDLPASGRVQVIDVDGSAEDNNITIDPPTGDSIMDGSANENGVISRNWFAALFTRRPSGTNWSVN